MDQRTIIIADRDVAYRSNMASFFRKAGYRVEATGSTDRVLNGIQDKPNPVLLLGSDFSAGVPAADLVHLLKKCNQQLQIILVSEGIGLAQSRQLRQEGVFYHALKPAPGEVGELGQAVQCAFEKYQRGVQLPPAPGAQLQAAVCEGAARPHLMHALPWIVGVAALIIGSDYISLSAARRAQESCSLSVWIFLGFCALIVMGQVLPIFRVRLAPARENARQAAGEGAARGSK
jgi:FixJ family two-component response regulator